MSFTAYSGLQSFLRSYVERSTETVPDTLIDDLMVLAEERIYADVRTKEMRRLQTGTYFSNVGIDYPSGFIGVIGISVEVDSKTICPLVAAEEAQLRQIEAEAQVTGAYAIYPTHFGVKSQEARDPYIFIAPDPGEKTYYLSYWAKEDPLSVYNTSSSLYSQYPGLFVFAALVELSLYLQDWEMFQVMQVQYQDRVQKINGLSAGDRDEAMAGTAPPTAWRS